LTSSALKHVRSDRIDESGRIDMRYRDFGRLGTVSALTLGGGGIGGVWGRTDSAEAVATVHAAIDAGITMLDVAPSYGTDHAAERVVGQALRARPAPDVMVTTKVALPDEEEGDAGERMISSLHASLDRLGRDHADLFLLHSQLRPAGSVVPVRRTLGWERYRDEVLPMFERLRAEGTIRAWGLTGVGHPQAIIEALGGDNRPGGVQIVVNALDLPGNMWIFGESVEPRNAALVRAAGDAGVPVIAIRAVAAGSLTTALDRAVDAEPATAADYARAAPFRDLAADLGESPASLAHRYALSVPGVATVVLGVKNRTELAECVAAEARGPLSEPELTAVLDLRAQAPAS
jgi:aryl-alcohol dehydrogenase-like predicted oxidoreductase